MSSSAQTSSTTAVRDGKKPIAIAMREPWAQEEIKIPIPAPDQQPPAPPPANLLTMLLPPIVMIIGMVIVSLLSNQTNLALILPMTIMSIGYPIANVISQRMAVKSYAEKISQREKNYRQALHSCRARAEVAVARQREDLTRQYPDQASALAIALARGRDQRLWWRRPADEDFLSLAVGLGPGKAALSFELPQSFDHTDALNRLPSALVAEFAEVGSLPVLIDFKRAGSLAVQGKSRAVTLGAVRRLLLDLIVHHSPEDVRLMLFADPAHTEQWSWMRWAPHTRALVSENAPRSLAFSKDQVDNTLLHLKRIYQQRKDQSKNSTGARADILPAYVAIFDDTGAVRQSEMTSQIAADGYQYGVYLLFTGEAHTPNACRARLNIDEHRELRYLEGFDTTGRATALRGQAEMTELSTCDQAARALAGLMVAGGQSSYNFPSTVRMAAILGPEPYELETIKANWRRNHPDEEQVRFPVGVYIARGGLETMEIDFRPDKCQGKDSFHAMLIGTSGSGKSIFLQSLALAGALRYSPNEINFLFMDFKAGAAELKKISSLPHVVGMINDLGPALAERALAALEFEVLRRKSIFDQASGITDIWDYNRRYPQAALPHLMVVIDEFGEGIRLMPNLADRLRELGRQGRAFGIYFMLANQEVNYAAETLKTNVGWYIVLKVLRSEEMGLIDRNLPIPPGRGRGYIRVRNEITEFQSAFSGGPAATPQQDAGEFVIESIGPDGERKAVIHNRAAANPVQGSKAAPLTRVTELDLLMERMMQVADELSIQPARRIYLDPLPAQLELLKVLSEGPLYRCYSPSGWSEVFDSASRLSVPIGMIDRPQACYQGEMRLNFNRYDGHLWIAGSPGSGKTQVLISIVQALAYTHRPEEVQFYVLDYGSQSLRCLEQLPHTGAVLRTGEQERLERLLRFFEQTVEYRAAHPEWRDQGQPELFLIINNYAELRRTYADQSEGLPSFVTRGKAAGIHIIITTTRSSELLRSISSNIKQRLVLQMASIDEYSEAIGARPPAQLTIKAEGRGYFVSDEVAECQVAQPVLAGIASILAPFDSMSAQPRVTSPAEIRTLEQHIPLPRILTGQPRSVPPLSVLVGVEYESLTPLWTALPAEMPNWLLLGPRQSGKTNALLALAFSLQETSPDGAAIEAFALRPGLLTTLAVQNKLPFPVTRKPDDISLRIDEILHQAEPANGTPGKPVVLMIDDLGAAFESGNEMVSMALNNLGAQLSKLTNLFVIAAASRDELQMQTMTNIVRVLRQSRTGLAFTRDQNDMDWLGAQLTQPQRKMSIYPGRGFFVSKGNARLVQVPWTDPTTWNTNL